jgi:hypothetical protein
MSKIKFMFTINLDELNSRGSLPWITPPESLSLPELLAWEPTLSLLFCSNPSYKHHPIELTAMEQMNAANLCLGPRIHGDLFIPCLALSIGSCLVLNDSNHLTFISFSTVWNNQIETYDSPLIMLTGIPCYTYLSRSSGRGLTQKHNVHHHWEWQFLHSYFCRTVNI